MDLGVSLDVLKKKQKNILPLPAMNRDYLSTTKARYFTEQAIPDQK